VAGWWRRRAYADWSNFDEDRRLLARAQVELIEIPQRLGASGKNAADIKMAVDAIELAFERSFVTTFAIGTGDSDFTPLVHKLRELDKRVIGIGVQSSTSALLPPACDEFLFYDRLPGVEPSTAPRPRRRGRASTSRSPVTPASTVPATGETAARTPPTPTRTPSRPPTTGTSTRWSPRPSPGCDGTPTDRCWPSPLKRAILRKDPTFDEADQGFRGFR